VPIEYIPTSLEESKKIRPIDGLIAVCTLLRFRFAALANPAPAVQRATGK